MISPSLCEYRKAGVLRRLESTPTLDNAMGNGNWQLAVYALFDSIGAVGLCLGLIPICHGLLHRKSKLGRLLSQHSCAVYVFHIPIIAFLAYAWRGIAQAPSLKFGLMSLVVVPTCFVIAALVRKVPFATPVL